MRYISTQQPTPPIPLKEAVLRCYAPGQGLYMPETLPRLPQAYLNNIEQMSLQEIAYVVASVFFSRDTDLSVIKDVVYDAFDFNIPLVPLEMPGGADVSVLELFHGPTLAFKDISARFMARYLRAVPRTTTRDIVLLVATTGNTGEAIAHAFAGVKGVQVAVLYPRRAMTAAEVARFAGIAPNVHAAEVDGDIDRCKLMVRDAVLDEALGELMPVVSGNTNNVVRLLPQIVYFFHAYARLRARLRHPEGFTLAIPCGNLSNLTSAVMARRMGLPVGMIVAGCNAHDSLVRVLEGSLPFEQIGLPCHRTVARAMDLGYPTNLPRLKALYGGDLAAMRSEIAASAVLDDDILATIGRVYRQAGYMVDPHTAVAFEAMRRLAPKDKPAVVLATAHPAKSSTLMEQITGRRPELSAPAECFIPGNARPKKLAPTLPALRKFLQSINP